MADDYFHRVFDRRLFVRRSAGQSFDFGGNVQWIRFAGRFGFDFNCLSKSENRRRLPPSAFSANRGLARRFNNARFQRSNSNEQSVQIIPKKILS
jgi:hypothetical protein